MYSTWTNDYTPSQEYLQELQLFEDMCRIMHQELN